MPIFLETLLGCAPVTVKGVSVSIWGYGSQDEMAGFEDLGANDSIMVTHERGGQIYATGSQTGDLFYKDVRDVSDQFGGIETWEGFASGTLGSHEIQGRTFNMFLVEPGEQQRMDVFFYGADKLPMGTMLTMETFIHYSVDSIDLFGKTVQRTLVISDPQP
jgi:hypothetical protein